MCSIHSFQTNRLHNASARGVSALLLAMRNYLHWPVAHVRALLWVADGAHWTVTVVHCATWLFSTTAYVPTSPIRHSASFCMAWQHVMKKLECMTYGTCANVYCIEELASPRDALTGNNCCPHQLLVENYTLLHVLTFLYMIKYIFEGLPLTDSPVLQSLFQCRIWFRDPSAISLPEYLHLWQERIADSCKWS